MTGGSPLSKHDELLLRDLRLQPVWMLWFYIAVGGTAVALAASRIGAGVNLALAAGGGFLVALGAEKLVTRRLRRAAAAVVASLDHKRD